MNTINKDYRVRIAWGEGSYSYEYFETLKQADLFYPNLRNDFMGFPKKPKRLTVQKRLKVGGDKRIDARNDKWVAPVSNEIRAKINSKGRITIIL